MGTPLDGFGAFSPALTRPAGLTLMAVWSTIRKSGIRFSEKIMLKQRDEIMIRFALIGS
jgi:hypothetical protein